VVDVDARRIQDLRRRLQYRDVAEAFRMIEDDTVSVVVRYVGSDRLPGSSSRGAEGVAAVAAVRRAADRLDLSAKRSLFARVQPFVVSLHRSGFDAIAGSGLASELAGDLWLWEGGYDHVRGLTQERDPDRLVV